MTGLKIKHLLFAWVFLVTWNEFELKGPKLIQWKTEGMISTNGQQYYTVEFTTKTITLATQKDVDLFLGKPIIEKGHFTEFPYPGVISDKAFNIRVKEIK